MTDQKFPGFSYFHKTIIKGSAESLFQFFTDPKFSENFFYGAKLNAPYKKGQDFKYFNPDGKVFAEGKITEFEPFKFFEGTFKGYFFGPAQEQEFTNFRFEFEQQGEYCSVTFFNFGFKSESQDFFSSQAAWAGIIAGYKYFAETGNSYGYKFTFKQAA